MKRRSVLATATTLVGAGTLAGCLRPGGDPAGANGTESPPPTQPSTTETATTVQSPDNLPEDCQPLPDIQGLPSRPEPLTEERVREYVTEFERTYAVAANDEYAAIDGLTVNHVTDDRGYYRASLEVDAVPPTETTSSEDSTATERPPDATAYRVQYLLPEGRVIRELRGYAGGSLLSVTCWTVASE